MFSPGRFRYYLPILLCTFAYPAAACQLCVSAMTYDKLRFTPIWLAAFLVWVVFAVFIDLRLSKLDPEYRKLSPAAIKRLLLYLVIGVLTGLALLLSLQVPVWLVKIARRNAPENALPAWVRKSAIVTLVILGLSVPASYLLLPRSASEVTTREFADYVNRDIESIRYHLVDNNPGVLPASLPAESPHDIFSYQLVSLPWIAPLVGSPYYYRPSKTRRRLRINRTESLPLCGHADRIPNSRSNRNRRAICSLPPNRWCSGLSRR